MINENVKTSGGSSINDCDIKVQEVRDLLSRYQGSEMDLETVMNKVYEVKAAALVAGKEIGTEYARKQERYHDEAAEAKNLLRLWAYDLLCESGDSSKKAADCLNHFMEEVFSRDMDGYSFKYEAKRLESFVTIARDYSETMANKIKELTEGR